MSDYGLIHGDFSPDGAGDFRGYDLTNNGRVSQVGPGTGPPAAFQIFSDDAGQTRAGAGTFASDTLQHVWKREDPDSAPTNLFMSKKNVDALQDAIRYRVWVDTGGEQVIGRQSDAELAIVMRSIVLQYGRNDGRSDVLEQVRELNARVIDWCVPKIVSEIKQYVRYREDASTLPSPMPYGGLATSKGTRQMEFKRFF